MSQGSPPRPRSAAGRAVAGWTGRTVAGLGARALTV